ncbi:hypothetical protein F5B22DRAFT_332381 [Xylaria bambusicola]|uniref:uncharacterized protein n=1 Tax=Xylaria bambusicola TaxID=326684 RepID=UPI0020080BB5|nr:uncharacterized protein F5B22DRAFT_332381 [Xylaria bambusicola]KAI0509462.1 hypothetical protein F5B22DRAFT_332381 [Xylaria bambusicola]
METSEELTVSLRLRLRKSRHGCQTCKRRKIKCDEVRPVCGNCARRFYDVKRCDYPSPSTCQRPSRQLSKHDAEESIPQPGSVPMSLMPKPGGVSVDPTQRQLEMRLFYHYTQFAALELPATYGYTSKELWIDKVPQMAFQSDLLLDSLLAVAALHMQDLTPEDPKLEMSVNLYLDRTLTKHRYNLGRIENKLEEPLFLTAFMLCITTWNLAHRRSPTSEYRIPTHVFALVRGCCALHRQYEKWLAQAGYDPGAIWLLAPNSALIQPDHPLLRDINQDIERLLDTFQIHIMPTNEANLYKDTASCVVNLYTALVLKMDNTVVQRLVFTMADRMKPEYVELLEAGQPLALALYARILTVLGFIDHLWWSRGSNNRDVLHYSIHGISNMMPQHFLWAMEWPLKALAGEITLTASN